jgi:hypothetical protein
MSQPISIRLSDGLLERVDEFARADHRTRSGAIQMLLERGLELSALARPDVREEPKVVAATAGVPSSSGPAKPEPEKPSPMKALTDDEIIDQAAKDGEYDLPVPEKPSPMKAKVELCGFRNPQVPFYTCFLPEGHVGQHQFT